MQRRAGCHSLQQQHPGKQQVLPTRRPRQPRRRRCGRVQAWHPLCCRCQPVHGSSLLPTSASTAPHISTAQWSHPHAGLSLLRARVQNQPRCFTILRIIIADVVAGETDLCANRLNRYQQRNSTGRIDEVKTNGTGRATVVGFSLRNPTCHHGAVTYERSYASKSRFISNSMFSPS